MGYILDIFVICFGFCFDIFGYFGDSFYMLCRFVGYCWDSFLYAFDILGIFFGDFWDMLDICFTYVWDMFCDIFDIFVS